MMLRTIALTIAALTATAALADVYRYVDERGQVQYTDRPRTLPAEKLDIESRRTDIVALNDRLEAERATSAEAQQAASAARARASDERQAAELSATDRAERCVKARERYEKYTTSHRLYEDLGGGERRYLSDSEIDAAREGARKAMEELCRP